VFRFCIVRWNLATPGRDAEDSDAAPAGPMTASSRASSFVVALGGAPNLSEVTACTTRLRLVLIDDRAIDEAALRRLGARGVLRTSTQGLQVVLGPIADQVAGEIRAAVRAGISPATPAPVVRDASPMLAALGGRGNVRDLEVYAGRLLVRAAKPELVDERALTALGVRGIARPDGASIQLLVAGRVEEWAEPLRRMLAAA
jgi:N-acetylglucosamine PTS system EIICBA or EIICB component